MAKEKAVGICPGGDCVIKRQFKEKEPLFGRATAKIDLKPLKFSWVRKICLDLGFKS
jgi:hypothetical protein